VITAFIGDNGPAREQAVKDYLDRFAAAYGALAIDKFDAEELEYSVLIEAVSSFPFLSPKRLIIVRGLSGNKDLAEKIEVITSSVAESNDLLIIESQIDRRGKYLTNLKKVAEIREFNHLEGEQLVQWVLGQAKSLNGKITNRTAQALIDRVGMNHQALSNELEKLILYQEEITPETINALTVYSPQSSIFAMLDAAFSGDASKALRLYSEQRAQGMEPQKILGMVAWQLHALNIVKAAGNMPVTEIAEKSKLSPFVIRKNQANARRLSEAKLLSLLDKAVKTDEMLKTTAVNADDAVLSLVMSF
jgi:DNA polymerase III subunit delta